jgi:hypothetical protein
MYPGILFFQRIPWNKAFVLEMKSLLVVAVQPGKYMFEKSISVVVYYRTQVERIQEPVN